LSQEASLEALAETLETMTAAAAAVVNFNILAFSHCDSARLFGAGLGACLPRKAKNGPAGCIFEICTGLLPFPGVTPGPSGQDAGSLTTTTSGGNEARHAP
jgi:hypothetical protein